MYRCLISERKGSIMREDQLKAQTAEVVRQAIRQEGIVQTASALDYIPELIGAVEFDLEHFQSIVIAELNKKTGNPVNAILGLLGLRIISTKDPLRTLGLEDDDAKIVSDGDCSSAGNIRGMMKLNQDKLEAAMSKMASALAGVEKQAEERRQAVRSESSQLYMQLEKTQQAYEQLTIDHNSQRSAVLERVQYMLGLCGPEDCDTPMTRQLTELLDDLDVQVYWANQEAPFPESAMFTTLRCEDTTKRKAKPCLANSQGVLLKGVKFVAAEA